MLPVSPDADEKAARRHVSTGWGRGIEPPRSLRPAASMRPGFAWGDGFATAPILLRKGLSRRGESLSGWWRRKEDREIPHHRLSLMAACCRGAGRGKPEDVALPRLTARVVIWEPISSLSGGRRSTQRCILPQPVPSKTKGHSVRCVLFRWANPLFR